VRQGIDVRKSQVLELGGEAVAADRARQRRIDFQRLAGYALALFRRHILQGAHIVQAVGQLDQQDTDVLRHRENKFAQVLGLLGVFRLQFKSRQLGDAFDQGGDLFAEQVGDFLACRRRILDRVV